MKGHLKVYLFASLIGSLMAVSVLAQAQPGSIRGVVNGAAGAVVPQAQIIFRNRNTSAVKIVRTDENGAYFVSEIAPGDYEARVIASGFNPLTQCATVEPDGRITLDFSLEPQVENEEASKTDEDSNDPGTSQFTREWSARINITSLLPIRPFALPFNLGGSLNSRTSYDPGGILMPTRNEYTEDKSGATDRLRNALRSAKPDGRQ